MSRYNIALTLPKGTTLEAEQTGDVVTTSTDDLSSVEFDVFQMLTPTRGWVSMLGSQHVSVSDVVDMLQARDRNKASNDEVAKKAFFEMEKLISSLGFTAPEDIDRKVREKVGYIIDAVIGAMESRESRYPMSKIIEAMKTEGVAPETRAFIEDILKEG